MSENQEEPCTSSSNPANNGKEEKEQGGENRPPNNPDSDRVVVGVLTMPLKKSQSSSKTETMEADTTGITLETTSNENSQNTDDQEQAGENDESGQNDEASQNADSPRNNEGPKNDAEETSNDESSTSSESSDDADKSREREASPEHDDSQPEDLAIETSESDFHAYWRRADHIQLPPQLPPTVDPEIIDVDAYAERVEREARQRPIELRREPDVSPPPMVNEERQEPMNLVRPSQAQPPRAMEGRSNGHVPVVNMPKRRRFNYDAHSRYVEDRFPTNRRVAPEPVPLNLHGPRGSRLHSPQGHPNEIFHSPPRPIGNLRMGEGERYQSPFPIVRGRSQYRFPGLIDIVNGAMGPGRMFSSFLQSGFPGGHVPAAFFGPPPPPPVARPGPVNGPRAQDAPRLRIRPSETITSASQNQDQQRANFQGASFTTYRSN